MMNNRLIILLLSVAPLLSAVAQTTLPYGVEQMLLVSDDQLMGTPRFVGLAGAMTAIGGDPSAVKQNPAGLGIYRHSQFSISADCSFSRSWQDASIDRGTLLNRWHLDQVSYVFAVTHPERLVGVVSNNLMISYAKRADLARRGLLNDRNTRPTNADTWLETALDESGYRNDIDLHYAMNISNRVYWGIGMTVEWMQMRQTIDRWEYASEGRRGGRYIYDRSETAIGNGIGWGASLGVLVRPVQAFRFGVSVESPIIGGMRQRNYYSEWITQGTEPTNEYNSPDYVSRWRLTTPLKASAGIGLQWTTHGLLSLQYDLQYHKLMGVAHTARAGLEIALTNHWMIEAGYAYTSFYQRQRATAAMHYMGRWIRVGLAYSYMWYNGKVIDSINMTEQGLLRGRENRLTLSFQWNS